MEKKSRSFHQNDPKDAEISNTREAGQEFEPVKQPEVKTIGDAEFDHEIDLFIHEMGIHS